MNLIFYSYFLTFILVYNTATEIKPDAFSSATIINITLNDGQKWETDEATTTHINNLKLLCESQLSEKTIDDELLRELLIREVNLLNRNTKMTGDSRAQLHNFQMGIRSRINTISQERDTVLWLTDYLDRFFEFFE